MLSHVTLSCSATTVTAGVVTLKFIGGPVDLVDQLTGGPVDGGRGDGPSLDITLNISPKGHKS